MPRLKSLKLREKAKAEAEKVAGTSKVEAQMTIEKTKQEKQRK